LGVDRSARPSKGSRHAINAELHSREPLLNRKKKFLTREGPHISEWRLHRQWFEQSAMADLLGVDYALVEKNALYRCLDKLLRHKTALFEHLRQRWQDLFGADFEVLLYDLTSTYFESPPPDDDNDKRRFGYSRDKRSDCVQVSWPGLRSDARPDETDKPSCNLEYVPVGLAAATRHEF